MSRDSAQIQTLMLRDTRARAVRNQSVSNLILEVEVRCHKAQGMTEAFTDTLYSRAKTSSSVHQKAVFNAFHKRDSR